MAAEEFDLLGLFGSPAPQAPPAAANPAAAAGWTCPGCQRANTAEMLFCPACGHKRPQAESYKATSQAAPSAQQAAPVQPKVEAAISYPSAAEASKGPGVFRTTAERVQVSSQASAPGREAAAPPPAASAAAKASSEEEKSKIAHGLRLCPATSVTPAVQLVKRVDASQLKTPSSPTERRFVVRCEGRWRLRTSPTLASRVLGTMPSGTVVVSEDLGPDPPMQDGKFTGSLWVRVKCIETTDVSSITEIKYDESTGSLYVLRRNALGYGLYEVGCEPLEGAYINLSEERLSELRDDAIKVSDMNDEDVKMHWRLLEAAESVTGWFTGFTTSSQDEALGGFTETLDHPTVSRVSVDDVFEAKQRDQIKQAATALHHVTRKLLQAVGMNPDAAMGALQKDVRRRYQRLRENIIASASASEAVKQQPPPASQSPSQAGSPAAASLPANQASSEVIRFLDYCAYLARLGPWPEMTRELKQEFMGFSHKYTKDIEQLGITLARASRTVTSPDGSAVPGRTVSTDSASSAPGTSVVAAQSAGFTTLLDLSDAPAPVAARAVPAEAPKATAPFLPPPPKPSAGLGLL